MIIAIVQARMGSKRLPGKVLLQVNNKPLLAHQIDRILMSQKIDKLVIATSTLSIDDAIEFFCKSYGIDCYRGSEQDVLSRYYMCAKKYNSEVIVRLTADCPLIDPQIIDKVIEKFQHDGVDYCANTVPPETSKFPDGSDVEVFSMQSLAKANREIIDNHRREHVTFQFWQDQNYTKSQYLKSKDHSKYRITVDYPEDFEVVKFIFSELKNKNIFGNLTQIIDIIDKNKKIKEKNSMFSFGQGWEL